jgi:TRAP-type C4-dicarboxylate transport system substrate-binding protein
MRMPHPSRRGEDAAPQDEELHRHRVELVFAAHQLDMGAHRGCRADAVAAHDRHHHAVVLGVLRSVEHLQKVLDGPIGNEILNSFEPYGFVGLTFYDSGARSIYNGVRPVRSIADIKGLRIRVQQSELMSDMIRALGAEPVELPYGQVLTGLATKLIDGAENNWPSFVTTDHYKYAGYYTLTEHTMSPEVLVMSQKAWESLSAEDRKIFRDAAIQSSRFMRPKWKDLEEQSRKQAKAAGVTIVTDFDRKPFEAAMAGIYAKAQRDPAAAELIERIRKVE